MPLFWRLFAVNAVILVLIAILLIASPVTISAPIHLAEAAIVLAGLMVTLAANFVLLRRALAPLDRLAERMEIVDLLRPGQRLPVRSGVVGRVIHSFNRMLDRLEAERHLTTQRALAAQEMERIGIARNLHDEVGQLLTGVLLQLDAIAENMPAHGEDIGETKKIVRQALEEVRRISSELRPEMLEHLGLISALIELATAFQKRSGSGLIGHSTQRLRVFRRRLSSPSIESHKRRSLTSPDTRRQAASRSRSGRLPGGSFCESLTTALGFRK